MDQNGRSDLFQKFSIKTKGGIGLYRLDALRAYADDQRCDPSLRQVFRIDQPHMANLYPFKRFALINARTLFGVKNYLSSVEVRHACYVFRS